MRAAAAELRVVSPGAAGGVIVFGIGGLVLDFFRFVGGSSVSPSREQALTQKRATQQIIWLMMPMQTLIGENLTTVLLGYCDNLLIAKVK